MEAWLVRMGRQMKAILFGRDIRTKYTARTKEVCIKGVATTSYVNL